METAAALRDAVSAEWTNLRTIPGNAWLLLASAAVTMAVSGLVASIDTCRAGCTAEPRSSARRRTCGAWRLPDLPFASS
jgi:hypothetical protein